MFTLVNNCRVKFGPQSSLEKDNSTLQGLDAIYLRPSNSRVDVPLASATTLPSTEIRNPRATSITDRARATPGWGWHAQRDVRRL